MATLTQIRKALVETIDGHTSMELFTYDYVEEMVYVPAIIAEPINSDFEGAFQRGLDTWNFNLYVLVSRTLGSGDGQEILDELVSGYGPNSIREILHNHSDLGLDEPTDAQCVMMKGYGGSFDWAGMPHIGAVLMVTVRTEGHN